MKVNLHEQGTAKFVVCRLNDGPENGTLIMESDRNADFHRRIVNNIRNEHSEGSPRCLGGGRLAIDPKAKTIRAYGYSVDFGKVSNEVVEKMLQEYVDNGWKVTLDMGSGY